LEHRSLQAGLRAWVETQTHHPLGYIEQLYTFADRDRSNDDGRRVISVSYLGLTREAGETGVAQVGWQDWYRYFPWEDHRDGPPAMVAELIAPRLWAWAGAAAGRAAPAHRRQRAALTFGLDGAAWNEDMVLQRYELLFEAGLVPEAMRQPTGINGSAAPADGGSIPPGRTLPGQAMRHDHRRILATGIARLRAKIK